MGFLPGRGPARAGRPARGAAQPLRPSSTRPATASAGLLLPAGPPAALLRPRGLPSAGLPSAHGRRGAGPAARSTLTLARAASAALEPRGPPTSRVGSRDGAAPGGVAPPLSLPFVLSKACVQDPVSHLHSLTARRGAASAFRVAAPVQGEERPWNSGTAPSAGRRVHTSPGPAPARGGTGPAARALPAHQGAPRSGAAGPPRPYPPTAASHAVPRLQCTLRVPRAPGRACACVPPVRLSPRSAWSGWPLAPCHTKHPRCASAPCVSRAARAAPHQALASRVRLLCVSCDPAGRPRCAPPSTRGASVPSGSRGSSAGRSRCATPSTRIAPPSPLCVAGARLAARAVPRQALAARLRSPPPPRVSCDPAGRSRCATPSTRDASVPFGGAVGARLAARAVPHQALASRLRLLCVSRITGWPLALCHTRHSRRAPFPCASPDLAGRPLLTPRLQPPRWAGMRRGAHGRGTRMPAPARRSALASAPARSAGGSASAGTRSPAAARGRAPRRLGWQLPRGGRLGRCAPR